MEAIMVPRVPPMQQAGSPCGRPQSQGTGPAPTASFLLTLKLGLGLNGGWVWLQAADRL